MTFGKARRRAILPLIAALVGIVGGVEVAALAGAAAVRSTLPSARQLASNRPLPPATPVSGFT
jgi:hypothetical protein